MLDMIKVNEANLFKFKAARSKDIQSVTEYNNEKKKVKGDHDNLRNKEKDIDQNITEFFKSLTSSGSAIMEQINTKNDKEQSYKVRFNYRIKEKQKLPFFKAVTKILKLPETIEEESIENIHPPS